MASKLLTTAAAAASSGLLRKQQSIAARAASHFARGGSAANPQQLLLHPPSCACRSCAPKAASGSRSVSSQLVLDTSPPPTVYHQTGCGCSKCGGKYISERELSSKAQATNRGVIFMGRNHVEVKGIPFPKLELDSMSSPVVSERQKRKCNHGAILKVVTTNICGSDQHMVRGRTSLPGGHMVLGHEITGEVVELGSDCETLEVGDIVSVPFNIACGRCAACKRGDTGVCLRTNPARPGAAYGYVDMGGWIGGQAEYVMVPYADFNLLKFPDRAQALEKIRDLTLLSDIFPTGFHGAVQAGVGPGSLVYVAGAGPVGLACAVGCQLLGAACVIVGDMIPERLAQARSFGCETVDLRKEGTLRDHLAAILPGTGGIVDGAVDCVGFEARGVGAASKGEVPAQVLNDCMDVVREGGQIGIPGLCVLEGCLLWLSLLLCSLRRACPTET
jgi:glutathione-independent formaldehyde dehydrogenase